MSKCGETPGSVGELLHTCTVTLASGEVFKAQRLNGLYNESLLEVLQRDAAVWYSESLICTREAPILPMRCYTFMNCIAIKVTQKETIKKIADVFAKDNRIDTILKERESTHGDYINTSNVAQKIKNSISNNNTVPVALDMRESLDMIATKIARIICGNPNNIDSWDDIAGYATLISNRLRKDAEVVNATKNL